MSALLTLALNFLRPYFLQIGIGVAVAIAAGIGIAYVHHKWVDEGEAKIQSKIDQQNAGAKNAADQAGSRVDECYATGGVWNVATGKCDGP